MSACFLRSGQVHFDCLYPSLSSDNSVVRFVYVTAPKKILMSSEEQTEA